MGPTWVLSAPDGPHVGSINLTIRVAALDDNSCCMISADEAPRNLTQDTHQQSGAASQVENPC